MQIVIRYYTNLSGVDRIHEDDIARAFIGMEFRGPDGRIGQITSAKPIVHSFPPRFELDPLVVRRDDYVECTIELDDDANLEAARNAERLLAHRANTGAAFMEQARYSFSRRPGLLPMLRTVDR